MRKRWKIILLLSVIFLVWFLSIGPGYQYRKLAAEMILSSQHRQLAWLTFLSPEELKAIQENIDRPVYKNLSPAGIVASLNPNHDKALTLEVENIEKNYGPDHYFRGKILYVSDPKKVKMITSTTPGKGEQIQVLAEKTGAVAAINANGFHDPNGLGDGGVPLGIIIENGVIMNAPNNNPNEKDYVAGMTKDGVLITGFYSANELLKMGVTDAGGFKPQLIVNGEKMIKKGNGGWGIAPRTAIGQKADGTIVMIVIEGRQVQSLGATLKDVQNLLYERGVINAIAMDGGSSSIMYVNGKTVTIPSSQGNISRFLPNAWVVIPGKNQVVNIIEKSDPSSSKSTATTIR